VIKLFLYAQRFLDPTDTSASLRHAMFALVVVAGVLFLAIDLGTGIVIRGIGISSDWCVAFGILAAAVTGGKLLGQKFGNGANNNNPPDVKE
jgi:hypothetical protein